MTRFQRLVLATAVATYIMIVIGATVRVTNSGLSCPDWPTCNGRFIPSADGHVLIEYFHRFFATIVSLLVALSAFVAWRSFRRDRAIVGFASASVVALIVQIGLGGATVTQKLSAPIVTSHNGTAMLLFAMVTLLALSSFHRTRPLVHQEAMPAGSRRFRVAALVAAAGMYVLLLSGAYTASSGAGTSCSTWPLCNGQFIPHSTRYVAIHFGHRVLVVLVTMAFAVLVFGAWRWLKENPIVQRAVRDGFGLFLLQILVGAANVWTKLATPVRVLHLAIGAALWCALVSIAWMATVIAAAEERRLPLQSTGSARPTVAAATREVAG